MRRYSAIIALIALLVLAFWAGRWFERQVSPPAAIAAREQAGDLAKEDSKAEDLTFPTTCKMKRPSGA